MTLAETNRVLHIDDISSQFSNTTSTQDGKVRLSINDDYESFLIQAKIQQQVKYK